MLANVNSRSRPSVCRLSVTFVRPGYLGD